jgi:hypothetical protein
MPRSLLPSQRSTRGPVAVVRQPRAVDGARRQGGTPQLDFATVAAYFQWDGGGRLAREGGTRHADLWRLEGRRTVLSLEPTTLRTILESVRQVGWTAGVAEHAGALAEHLRARLDAVARFPRTTPPRPATQMLPPLARVIAEGLLPAATACDWQFAVISPERAGCGPGPGAASGAAE